MKQQPKSSRYDSQQRNRKFIEIISKQLNIKTSNNNQKQQTHRNSRVMSNNNNNNSKYISKNIQQIYSQVQIPRQRRGTSFYKISARDNNRTSKSQIKKQFFRDSSMNFYEGLLTKKKYKQQQTVTMGYALQQQDLGVQQIHYRMVKVHQDAKRIQMQI